ncbi:GcrA family cell cycle regulator [Nitratireductor aquimarinus]|uniref:GcrA family cell cycle regulator n=1 Tax=Nitratireductor aquimarinus TaxID=889300 RepID=UPI0029359D7A|nr:GcrA family cell cycle regulator [Nitratireductor aquimarinus]MDV2964555.1 GcrA family cell cycle regulator [Nitratireductor aquimarinus]
MLTKPDWKTLSFDNRFDAVQSFAAAGLSGSQIAAKFQNVTRNAILGFCHRHGLALGRVVAGEPSVGNDGRPNWKGLSPEELRARVGEMAAAGLTVSEIAQRFCKVSRSTVDRFCKINGIATPASTKRAPPAPKGNKASKPVPPMPPAPDTSCALSYREALTGGLVCKWPLWDVWAGEDESYCCGAPREPGVSYCEYHKRISVKGVSDENPQD